MVNNTELKHCKLAAKENASPAENASGSDCGDWPKLQAKLLHILPWKVAGQPASRVGQPTATA